MTMLRRSLPAGRHIVACISVASSPCLPAARGFAADAAPALKDDIVLETFKESQKSYRDFLAGMQNIDIPLDGDDAAIRKYASQVEALKRKVGMPSIEEIISAGLDHKMAMAGWNARKYLALAQDGVQFGDYGAVVEQLGKAVDEIEASTGAPLDPNNKEGWSQLQSRVEAIEKSNGLTDYNKLRESAMFNMYKEQLAKWKADAVEAMETVKKREGLESVTVDVKELSIKDIKL